MSVHLPLILFTVLTNGIAQILLKQGMLSLGPVSISASDLSRAVPAIALNPFVLMGLAMFVISMSSHLVVLSKVELSFAYPFLSLAYVFVAICSVYLFGETLGYYRIAGIALIVVGTVLISYS